MALIKSMRSSHAHPQTVHQPSVAEPVRLAPHRCNLYSVCYVASSSPLTRSLNTVVETCALRVCQNCSVSLVPVVRRTKAPQNSTRKALHSKTTLFGDARPVTLARPATRLLSNAIWNWMNLSANSAIYLHLAHSVGSCSLGTCTILLNGTAARLWIASCDVKSA